MRKKEEIENNKRNELTRTEVQHIKRAVKLGMDADGNLTDRRASEADMTEEQHKIRLLLQEDKRKRGIMKNERFMEAQNIETAARDLSEGKRSRHTVAQKISQARTRSTIARQETMADEFA